MTRWLAAGVVVLVALVPVRAQTADQRKESIAYLQSLQTKEGGFLAARDAKAPSLRATSSAVRAIKYFGGEVQNKKGCAEFVASCFDANSGGFKDTPDAKETGVAVTAVGLMAVVELKMPQDKYVEPAVNYLTKTARSYEEIRIAAAGLEVVKANPDKAKEWLKEITSKRNDNGSYGKGDEVARLTGGTVVIEMRLGGKVDKQDAVLKLLREAQQKDGGWQNVDAKGSDLETCYRIMRAFHMMKEKPDAKSLRSFIAKCRKDDGGYGVTPDQKSTLSATYYAAVILYWLDKE